MSAWVVSKHHIDVLVTAAIAEKLTWGECHSCIPENASAVGQMLWNENQESVNHRYRSNDEVGPYEFQSLRISVGDPDQDIVVILKAIDCYEYQSCEHDAWVTSDAYAFCQKLRKAVITGFSGYDKAPWGIE